MFCTKCGNPVADDAKFCTKCGNPLLNAAPNDAPNNVPAPMQANETNPADFLGREMTFGTFPETKITVSEETLTFEQDEDKQEIPLREITGAAKVQAVGAVSVIAALAFAAVVYFAYDLIAAIITGILEIPLSVIWEDVNLASSGIFSIILKIAAFCGVSAFFAAICCDRLVIHRQNAPDLRFQAVLWDEDRKNLDGLLTFLNKTHS